MWPKSPFVGRYTIERLPLYIIPDPKPVLPTMKVRVADSQLQNCKVFVSVLSPALVPPALETTQNGFPKKAVLCEFENKDDVHTATAKQRVQIVEVTGEQGCLPECVVFPIMDRDPTEEEIELSIELERKIQNIMKLEEGANLSSCKPKDPYELVMNRVSDQYLLDREMFGFAVASRFDLSLAESLALLNTMDGVGRLEWLYWHAVMKCGRKLI
jgi:hypothetical protein